MQVAVEFNLSCSTLTSLAVEYRIQLTRTVEFH